MNIKEIRLVNFKNIEDSTIVFKNNMSGIYGPNGMGKTAIIEAISLVKDYFSNPLKKDGAEREERFINKLNTFMKKDEDYIIIETLFNDSLNNNQYRLILEFQKNQESYFCSREELNFRKIQVSKSGRIRYSEEKELIKINSNLEDIIPSVIITDFNKTDFVLSESLDGKTLVRDVLRNYSNFYSLMFQITNFTNGLQEALRSLYIKNVEMLNYKTKEGLLEENKEIGLASYKEEKRIKAKIEEDSKTIKFALDNLEMILKNILIIELKDQLLCRDTISIPIKCFENNAVKTIIYNEDQNIYDEDEADMLEKTIKEIGGIISIIIPNSKLIAKVSEEGINAQRNTIRKSVVLYIMKNDVLIPLVHESTGTIKLVSLISTLIFSLKNEKATVFIDEFDVHIFEYLLATLLLVISKYLKGQLVFTAHNLLPMEKLDKDSIIIATKNESEIKYTFVKTSSKTNNVRLKYLKSQAMWSEENIDPLLLNIPKLEVFIQRLVLS